MIIRLLSFMLLWHLQETSVDAFPSGAGGCAGNMAAVAGYHLDDSGRVVSGATLAEGEIEVRIASTLLSTETVADFPTGQDLQISVNALDTAYKGVLVRLEAPAGVSTTAALLPDTNTQVASVCTDPIIGITHTNNSTKTTSTGTIRFDSEVLNVTLDVTVVFINNAMGSFYVYSRFIASFRDVATPVVSPITTPVTAPEPTPVVSPITTPVTAPVPTPVVSPISTPVTAPVPTPASAPIDVPVPLSAPISAPVLVPSPVSAPLPVSEPVPAPISVPVPAATPQGVPVFVPTPVAGPPSGVMGGNKGMGGGAMDMGMGGGAMDMGMGGGAMDMGMGGGAMGMGGGAMGMGGGAMGMGGGAMDMGMGGGAMDMGMGKRV